MSQTAHYRVARARSAGPIAADHAAAIGAQWREQCRAAGLVPWGAFVGVLGLRTDELLLVAAGSHPFQALPLPPGLAVVDDAGWVPTARPAAPEPQTTPGVYVFRWFAIAPGSLDEFVRLSVEAWESFEHSPDYRAEPRALLCDPDPDPTAMLLITWYDSLTSWERSRLPAPPARQNFAARARLTRWALPVATRLA